LMAYLVSFLAASFKYLLSLFDSIDFSFSLD
jgi:hypothetical protein